MPKSLEDDQQTVSTAVARIYPETLTYIKKLQSTRREQGEGHDTQADMIEDFARKARAYDELMSRQEPFPIGSDQYLILRGFGEYIAVAREADQNWTMEDGFIDYVCKMIDFSRSRFEAACPLPDKRSKRRY